MKIIGKKYSALVLVIFILFFVGLFANFVSANIKPIFAKDLYFHDESSNSVVGANVYRQFFPPQLRLNPLIENYKISDWLEAKYWMHVPPAFAYIPYPLYVLDGQVSVEMKRLSYALVTLLTGIFFMAIVRVFLKDFKFLLASFVAVALWLNLPYTKDLIMGFQFGLSDILLAFTTVLSFASVAYFYRHRNEPDRIKTWHYLVIGGLCALPFAAKSMLGLIPFATMILAIIYRRNFFKSLIYIVAGFVVIAAVFYLPLYLASPKIFVYEFMTSFKHFDNYEGWQRPWNIFFTDYLPNRYLIGKQNMNIFFALYALGFVSIFLIKDKTQRAILLVSGIWFLWNLAVVSFVKSKAPNFVYSTILFGIFFVIANISVIVGYIFKRFQKFFEKISVKFVNISIVVLLLVSGGFMLLTSVEAGVAFAKERVNNAQIGENAQFYDLSVYGRDQGWNSDDLVIINSENAYWLRFYVMFISGSEGVHSGQMEDFLSQNRNAKNIVMKKYKRVHFIKKSSGCVADPFYIPHDLIQYSGGYTIYSFNSEKLNHYVPSNKQLCY